MKVLFYEWEKKLTVNIEVEMSLGSYKLRKAMELFKFKVEERTPVGKPELWKYPYAKKDYVPGNLKASWDIDFNKQGRYRITGGTVYNTAEYAVVVEKGHSTKQAPQGMMRITAMEWDDIVKSV